ncbi:SDR family NAD(P)-dependent oxidoreductase [Polynucleobacter sp. AP-Nino-20-G2]|uniref:SDR family NAD(P)-dependent oxidoreductase n=1 Tax=Polynucleobacter sp. AP-Nino-20-G2 TaxID=2576917 RepID=UPI001BFE04E2|nr:SDR family oxidoreductase [Polynucleobacter sp. AP-Nino-20-G2]QWE17507.1 SDR family oxidoreductase [Polynucleobacter sp. AP-Nino-20-G2]
MSTKQSRSSGEFALVTGASSGIGRAVALRLIEDGMHVINFDLNTPAAINPHETFVKVDVSNESELRSALANVSAQHCITRLVNNAGIVRPATIEHATTADLHAVMNVNVAAAIICAQSLLPGMRAAKFGRIVNISSRAALGKAERIVYATTKAAIHGFTRTLALEVAADGITVNAIGPGPIATELFTSANPPEAPATKRILETVPLRRIGKPDEVAHLVASLLDERAGYTTGQVIYVCGGMTVGLAL